jgi:antitoxin CcdA
MRMNAYSRGSRKKAVNLSIDAELLADSKTAGLNLSQVLEDALRARRVAEFKNLLEPGLEYLNERLKEEGVWSDGMRPW